MMIAIGCDHAAIALKEAIIEKLKDMKIEVKDFGAEKGTKASDYPDYAVPVCKSVVSKECELGILICGTGIGMSMAANKIKGIRCAHCSDTFSSRAAREHNDANVLALGERVTGVGLALDIVKEFVLTKFTGEERHVRRIAKVMELEKSE